MIRNITQALMEPKIIAGWDATYVLGKHEFKYMLQHCAPLGSFGRNKFTAPVLMPPPELPKPKVPKKGGGSTKPKAKQAGKLGGGLANAFSKASKLPKQGSSTKG